MITAGAVQMNPVLAALKMMVKAASMVSLVGAPIKTARAFVMVFAADARIDTLGSVTSLLKGPSC